MKKKYKIAVVNSSSFGKIYTQHLERLKKIGEVSFFNFDSEIEGKELANRLNGYNMIIASVTPYFGKEFFDNKDELLLLSRHGIGYNTIDVEAAKKHGTVVTIVPALIERDAVAENNITNLLSIMRKTGEANHAVKTDNWKIRASFLGDGLSGTTVGVIGVGNIGSRVVEILNYGFRCNVLGYDPNVDELSMERFGAKKVGLDELLSMSDEICICASLNEDNYHMLSTKEFNKMKKGVYISNTARGALVDEKALLEAVNSGAVEGFATDVMEIEPSDSSHPYNHSDKILVTPHTSAYTNKCLSGMGEKCVSDCEAVANGKLPNRIVS